MRLFPLSSIKKYFVPSLTVKNSSYTITNSFSDGINPFTGINLQNITVKASNTAYITSVTIENSSSTILSDGTLQTTGDIVFIVAKNPYTWQTISANIIVTGTRTDGQNNVSKTISLTWNKALYAIVANTDIPINIPYNGSKQINIESNTSWTASLTSSSNYDFGNGVKSKSSGGNGRLTIYNTGGSQIASNDDTLTISYGGMQNTYRVKLIGT